MATVVLPTPPFGLKTAMTVAGCVQPSASSGAALQDGPGAVVDGLAADAHRLDPPAQRLGGVGAGEVFVLDAAARTRAELVERPGRHDHERRDRPAAVAQETVELERSVEVGLAVKDRDRDVACAGQERLELVRVAHGHDA